MDHWPYIWFLIYSIKFRQSYSTSWGQWTCFIEVLAHWKVQCTVKYINCYKNSKTNKIWRIFLLFSVHWPCLHHVYVLILSYHWIGWQIIFPCSNFCWLYCELDKFQDSDNFLLNICQILLLLSHYQKKRTNILILF